MPENPSLDQALPELRAAEQRLSRIASDNGISYVLAPWGGMRTQTDTTTILKIRNADYQADIRRNPRVALVPINTYRPIAPFGRSMHNWGSAFDIKIIGTPPGMTAARALAILGALAPTIGLRWGGTFPSDRIDPPHFELPLSVVDARARYLAYTNGKGYVGPRSPLDLIRNLILPSPRPASIPEPTLVLPGIEVIQSLPQPTLDLGPVTAAELPEEELPPETYAPQRAPVRQMQQRVSPPRALPVRGGAPTTMTAQEIKRRQQLALLSAIFVGAVVIMLLRNSED